MCWYRVVFEWQMTAASEKSSILQNCTHTQSSTDTLTTWLKTKLAKLYHTKTYTHAHTHSNYLSWTNSNNTNNSTATITTGGKKKIVWQGAPKNAVHFPSHCTFITSTKRRKTLHTKTHSFTHSLPALSRARPHSFTQIDGRIKRPSAISKAECQCTRGPLHDIFSHILYNIFSGKW